MLLLLVLLLLQQVLALGGGMATIIVGINCLFFCVIVILKRMAEFVTESVELAYFFSIVTNFSVQAMRSYSF